MELRRRLAAQLLLRFAPPIEVLQLVFTEQYSRTTSLQYFPQFEAQFSER